MSLIVKKYSGNNKNLNLNAIAECQYFSIFQSEHLLEVFNEQGKTIPFTYVVTENDQVAGSLTGVIYKHKMGYPGFLTNRMVIWGGPLFFEDSEDKKDQVLDVLLKRLLEDHANNTAIIEFRNLYDFTRYQHIFSKYQFKFSDKLNCIIDTSDKNTVLGNIKPSKIRQIERGLERSAIIAEASDISQVKEFYQILADLYKYKIKKPLPEFLFFESFYNWGKRTGMGVILLVILDKKVIGGSLCPITPRKEIFEWYNGALTEEYRKFYPGVLATWAPIDYALKNKIPKFNFMGLGSPDKPYGVRDFKLQFGGSIENYGRFIKINNPSLFKLTKFGYRLLGFRE